ncbi:hypothetical protein H8D85_01365 [bacterium]|nr:hypothetical protein [bacterium]
MGYRPFTYGEQLNPDKLNSKFEQVYKLLKKAHSYNNELKQRLQMINTAFYAVAKIADQNGDGSIDYTVPASYDSYDVAVNSGSYELYVGANKLVTDGALTNIKTDGFNLLLGTAEGKSIVSRVPLSLNDYNERVPSLGVEIESEHFNNSTLINILSPDIIWGESVVITDPVTGESTLASGGIQGLQGDIYLTLPATLSPYMNTVKVIPVPGTQYKLYRASGEVYDEITDGWTGGTHYFYMRKDIFTGQFKLELSGPVDSDTIHFGIVGLEAYYDPFVEEGTITGQYILSNTNNVPTTVTGLNIGISDADDIEFLIKNNNDEIVYNSGIHAFPFPGVSETFDLGDNILRYEIKLKQAKGKTPAIPYLKVNYKES